MYLVVPALEVVRYAIFLRFYCQYRCELPVEMGRKETILGFLAYLHRPFYSRIIISCRFLPAGSTTRLSMFPRSLDQRGQGIQRGEAETLAGAATSSVGEGRGFVAGWRTREARWGLALVSLSRRFLACPCWRSRRWRRWCWRRCAGAG